MSEFVDVSARMSSESTENFSPFEAISGDLAGKALVICDHASNAIPREYEDLGLSREALQRHIAFDIGAAEVARTLAVRLGVPAVLSTFSRLLIDPNRGSDDPTLVMCYSDGAIVPGNARADGGEIGYRRDRYWAPYRDKIAMTVDAMTATGEPPAIVSIHSFTPYWRGDARPWKVGVLWDKDDRIAHPLVAALLAEVDLGPSVVGDNEPYDGALAGDMIDAVATSRGLTSALIEIRQDLLEDVSKARSWGDRLANLLRPILADRATREPRDLGSRVRLAHRARRA
jgi:predicted N-formylglutamate amidohydrolase